ncbi:MAG: DUF4160 domain-containing protein [Candidatus Kuenenia stuttgartiensis]|jgi:hypothetical protein|uniref:DUF4160 domain-containing protein n=1 Tax=Kuenenia stuttgartiensis TaxID=174633 RepID=A0A2C9CMY2_KUEST|nr:DUF4160 domain-containing protein [Candidatus Kuenenia stuttgartiensis]MBE7549193.1 DUF4160 domain-containing protein [Planctomycetia bacterium]MBZ0193362.1 DUF4160 domain-containing protein [Candidatus Kuenenia stuttgartiensis]MCL4728224.1 DUF4160 domain-containing protein [Candidatus Kuenenia stuttgartiensis]SOH06167.1 hypothetical protein KSMBR1_3694 [Candidatus Kuenenia stuttgartiensis]GJQ51065.1 MAG: hypothetical protein HKUEN01_34510 [Candidatus Kuenenia stuttgartiensis]
MPTILYINGWRIYFFANESNESIHVHCQKSEKRCKYWLDKELFEIEEAHSYNMNNKDKRIVRKIIFEHFDYIVEQWEKFEERKW